MRLLGLLAAAIGGALIGFLLGLGVATASTERDTARPHEPTRTNPGLVSPLEASRCGSADGESRRSLRGKPPLRGGSSQRSSGESFSGRRSSEVGGPRGGIVIACSSGRFAVLMSIHPTGHPDDPVVDFDRVTVDALVGELGSEGVHDGSIYPSVDAVNPLLSGTATWYCSPTSACTRGYGPSDLVAAIDPSLGIPKGTVLEVTSGGRSVTVAVVDVCACPGQRVIDLTSGAFSRLAPLSRGVITVSLSEVEPRATLPPTDTRYEP